MDSISPTLANVHTIAVVGAKDTTGHPVDRVGRYLMDAGFTVYPVHPVRKKVWGLETFASLADVPGPIDLVDVFRASEYCPGHARECLALPVLPKVFWMQLGIKNAEVRILLEPHGIVVVEDACLMVEHARGMTPGGVS